MDALDERLLRELSQAGPLSAGDLAARVNARQWADLSSALSQLVAGGYVTVIGPLGRAETSYRIHERGVAALGQA
jgi:DNA-binding Lrp family transcriptional regulator